MHSASRLLTPSQVHQAYAKTRWLLGEFLPRFTTAMAVPEELAEHLRALPAVTDEATAFAVQRSSALRDLVSQLAGTESELGRAVHCALEEIVTRADAARIQVCACAAVAAALRLMDHRFWEVVMAADTLVTAAHLSADAKLRASARRRGVRFERF